MAKDKVIPVRMTQEEVDLVDELAQRSGLPRAEIIRRAYRFLAQEAEKRGTVGFILDETAPLKAKEVLKAAEDPKPYEAKGK